MKTIDKRLGIEIAALRQSLWRCPNKSEIYRRLQDHAPEERLATDIIRWVDTAAMPADPRTKYMNDSFLQNILDTGTWNFKERDKSKEVKRRKQEQRRSKKKYLALAEYDIEEEDESPK